jgi:hypothetical protein
VVYLGETIRYKCQFKDFDDTIIQPTTHTITVTNPSGSTVHSDSSPTWDSENQLYYTDFTIPADGSEGNYKIVWKATYGSNTWVTRREFAVEAT